MLRKFQSKKGWLEIGDKHHYFKSSWERNYARFLEWQKSKGMLLDWEYEPDTFWFEKIKRGCRSYLPDFKITWMDGTHEYHEIKGWLDAKSNTKLKRMALYYPAVRVTLINKKCYKNLEALVSRMVPDWER